MDSYTLIELIAASYVVVLVNNFCNSSKAVYYWNRIIEMGTYSFIILIDIKKEKTA